MNIEMLHLEQGPIRPPSESRSLLLRLTRNCPWNQCLFCPVYKDRKFSRRPVAEILQDIQAARDMVDDIQALSRRLGSGGAVDNRVVSHIAGNSKYGRSYRSIAVWLYYGTSACFLQDADNLVLPTDDLVTALTFLKEKFPEITRITTYARSRSVTRKSPDALARIRTAGLNRVHMGLETGCDPLLKFMKKGTTSAIHVEAGQKLIDAGMEVSEYVMPGLGGQGMWREHAIETARTLNQINPHFIRLRSLQIPERTALHQKRLSGDFVMQHDDQVVEEIRLFIEMLDGITSMVASDHIMNLLENVSGKLPEDKPAMLEAIDAYQRLSDTERLIYRVGRRGSAFRSVDDFLTDTQTRQKLTSMIEKIQTSEGLDGVERFISNMTETYL